MNIEHIEGLIVVSYIMGIVLFSFQWEEVKRLKWSVVPVILMLIPVLNLILWFLSLDWKGGWENLKEFLKNK